MSTQSKTPQNSNSLDLSNKKIVLTGNEIPQFIKKGLDEGLYNDYVERPDAPAMINGKCILCFESENCWCGVLDKKMFEPVYISQRESSVHLDKNTNPGDFKKVFLDHCSIYKFMPDFEDEDESFLVAITKTDKNNYFVTTDPHNSDEYIKYTQEYDLRYVDNWHIHVGPKQQLSELINSAIENEVPGHFGSTFWVVDFDMTHREVYTYHRDAFRKWKKVLKKSNKKNKPRVPKINVSHALPNKNKYVIDGLLNDVPKEVINYLFDDNDKSIYPSTWEALSEKFKDLTIEQATRLLLLCDEIPINNKNGMFGKNTARNKPVHWDKMSLANTSLPPEVLWMQVLNKHYEENPHHLENENASKIGASIERMLDYHASSLRLVERPTESIKTFLPWIVDIQKNDAGVFTKFEVKGNFAKNTSPIGVLLYMKSLMLHGISSYSKSYVKADGDARSSGFVSPEMSHTTIKALLDTPQNKRKEVVNKIPEWKINLSDTYNHIKIVNSALKFFRMKQDHDADKLNYDRLVVYMWKWCVEPRKKQERDYCILASGFKSVSSSLTSLLGDKFESFKSDFTSYLKDDLLSGVVEQAKKTLDQMLSILGPISNLFAKIKDLIKQFISFTGLDAIEFNGPVVLKMLMCWIAYCGTESSIIRAGCLYLASVVLGIKDRLFEAIDWAATFFGYVPISNKKYCSATDTALRILKKILKPENAKYAGIGVGIFVILFLGKQSLDSDWVKKQGGAVMSVFKNMHFIGAGIAGLSRVVTWITSLAKTALDWIAKTFYNEEPEDEKKKNESRKLQDDLAIWIATATAMCEEEVGSRMSQETPIQEHIKKIYNKGLEYQILINKSRSNDFKDELIPRSLATEFTKTFEKLGKVHNRVLRITKYGKPRATPFHVQFVGDPGVGKTTLIETLTKEIRGKKFRNVDPGLMRYSDPGPSVKFKDGYRGQPIYYFDDMWKVLDAKLIVEYLSYVSSCPVILPMSHLEEKETYFTSPFILSTTNVPHPNVPGVACSEAVYRRRHLLVEVVCDKKVLDKSNNTFSVALFNEHYKGKNLYDFPHLTFNFLNPLDGSEDSLTIIEEQYKRDGLPMPIKGLNFEQFVQRFWLRHEQVTAAEIKEYGDITNNETAKLNSLEEIRKVAKEMNIMNDDFLSLNGIDVSRASPEVEATIEVNEMETNVPPVPTTSVQDVIRHYITISTGLASEFHVGGCSNVNLEEPCKCDSMSNSAFKQLYNSCEAQLYEFDSDSMNPYDRLLTGLFVQLGVHSEYFDNRIFFLNLLRFVYDNESAPPQGEYNSLADNFSRFVGKWKRLVPPTLMAYTEKDELATLFKIECQPEEHWKVTFMYCYYKWLVTNRIIEPIVIDTTIFPEETRKYINDYCVMNERFDFTPVTLGEIDPDDFEEMFAKHLYLTKTTAKESQDRLNALEALEKEILSVVSQEHLLNDLKEVFIERFKIFKAVDGVDDDEAYSIFRLGATLGIKTWPNVRDPHAIRAAAVVTTTKQAALGRKEAVDRTIGYMNGCVPTSRRSFKSLLTVFRDEYFFPISDIPFAEMKKATQNMEQHPDIGFLKYMVNCMEKGGIRNKIHITLHQRAANKLGYPSLCGKLDRISISAMTLDLLEEIRVKEGAINRRVYAINVDRLRKLIVQLMDKSKMPMDEENANRNLVYFMMLSKTLQRDMNKLVLLPHSVVKWFKTVSYVKNAVIDSYERLINNIAYIRNTGVQGLLDRIRATGLNLLTFLKNVGWFVLTLLPTLMVITLVHRLVTWLIPAKKDKEKDYNSRIVLKNKTSPQQPQGPKSYCVNIVKEAHKYARYTRTAYIGGTSFTIILAGGHYVIAPYHSLREFMMPGKEKEFVIRFRPTFNYNMIWQFRVPPEKIYHIDGTDACVLRLDGLVPNKDFTRFMITENEFKFSGPPTSVTTVYRQIEDISGEGVNQQTLPCRDIRENSYDECMDVTYNKVIELNGQWVHGSSGGPVFASNPTYDTQDKFLGVVSYNMGAYCYITMVTKEDYLKAVSHLEKWKPTVESSTEPPREYCQLEQPSKAFKLVEDEAHLVYHGKAVNPIGSPIDTKIELSPIASYLPFPSKRIPAVLNPRDPRLTQHPLKHSLTKSGRDVVKDFPEEYCAIARSWLVNDINRQIDRVNRGERPRLLTFKESVEGMRKPGSEPIKTNTSPGIPWIWKKKARGKQTWINANEDGTYEVDDEVRQEYHRILSSFLDGKVPEDLMMYDIAKDELRPIDKAIGNPPKTRSITVDNMCVSLVYRTLFHDLERILHLAGDGRYEFLPGLDITGRDGIVLHRRLSKFKYGIDLDVGNWDGHFTKQMFDNVVSIVNRLYDHDYDFEPLARARQSVAHHWCYAKVQYQDMIYQKCRGLPSGAAGTTLFNTLGHQFMAMVIYLMLCDEHKKHHLMTLTCYRMSTENGFHGDDRVTTMDDMLLSWYNGKTIAEKYTDFGFPATSATSKTAEVELYKPLEELTILKRSPLKLSAHVFDIVWALDKDVLYDLCYYVRKTPNENEQFAMNVYLALEGMCRHGEYEYNKFVSILNPALMRAGYPRIIQSWEDMIRVDRFRVLGAFNDTSEPETDINVLMAKFRTWLVKERMATIPTAVKTEQ